MAGTAGAFNGESTIRRRIEPQDRKGVGGDRHDDHDGGACGAPVHEHPPAWHRNELHRKCRQGSRGGPQRKRHRSGLIKGMGILKSIDMGDIEPEQTYRFARDAFEATPDVDGFLIRAAI